MGRTIKISELKKFDVCLINGKPYMFTDYAYDGYLFLEVGGNNESWDNEDTLPETELLGRMEFKEEPAQNIKKESEHEWNFLK